MGLLDIEKEASGSSAVHRLDGRVKVISFVLIVLSAVIVGRSGEWAFVHRIKGLAFLEIYLLAILFLARVDKFLFLKRVALILPFGGAIAFLKPFVEEGSPIYTFPLGITATYEGLLEGALLSSIMIVSTSSVVLLSSTTTVPKLVDSLRRLGMPKELALLFGMTLRYLFLYFETFQRITEAQKTRCFNIRNRRVKLGFILEQIGYTITMLFIMSYRQGLSIHQSMASRGYNPDSSLVSAKSKITFLDAPFLALTILVVGSVLLL